MSVAAAGKMSFFSPTKVARLSLVLLVYERAQFGQLLAAQEIDPVALDPREQVGDQRRQLERVEGLGDVLDATDIQPTSTVAHLGPSGQEDDRYLLGGLARGESLRHVPAVETGHHHVEQNHVGQLGPGQLDPLLTVEGLDDLHPFGLEIDTAKQPDRLFVVDYQDARHRVPVLYPSPARLTPLPPTRFRTEARARRWSPHLRPIRPRCARPSRSPIRMR